VNYYTNIGANIDNEDYFELMIRNAWHISGGEGAAANSANKRVLVTRADGSQSVEEIKSDLGLKANDKAGMMARLRAQGVDASNISLFDGGDDGVGKDKKMTPASKGRGSVGDSFASPNYPKGSVNNRPSTAPAQSPSVVPHAGIQMIIDKLKGEIRGRGGNGFIALQRKFKIMDDDGSKSLDLSEFKKALKEMNMGLNDKEMRMLFDHFDTDHGGSVNFEEFIQGVRDPLTPRRQALVLQAFTVIDKDGSGVVDAEEIASMYDASAHPDVIAGKKTPKQVMNELNFSTYEELYSWSVGSETRSLYWAKMIERLNIIFETKPEATFDVSFNVFE
jgi:Ca2+-binding EF-hand superfamily protein